jgi:hypothetical protein
MDDGLGIRRHFGAPTQLPHDPIPIHYPLTYFTPSINTLSTSIYLNNHEPLGPENKSDLASRIARTMNVHEDRYLLGGNCFLRNLGLVPRMWARGLNVSIQLALLSSTSL